MAQIQTPSFSGATPSFGYEGNCTFSEICIALEFTQPLTDMSTRNIKIIMFLGSKVRLVLASDNLTAICEPIV
jgi:hypothetical protein